MSKTSGVVAGLLVGLTFSVAPPALANSPAVTRDDGAVTLTFSAVRTPLIVRQRGGSLTVVTGSSVAVTPATRLALGEIATLHPCRGGLRVELDPHHRPSWVLSGNQLLLSSTMPNPRRPKDPPSSAALVPGLPFPFIASVEGQVRNLLAKTTATPTDAPSRPRASVAGQSSSSSIKREAEPEAQATSNAIAARTSRDEIDLGIPTTVGLAAVRAGLNLALFLERPLPLGSAIDPVLAPAVQPIGGGSLLRLHLPASPTYRLRAIDGSWRLASDRSSTSSDRLPIAVSHAVAAVVFEVGRAGHVLTFQDPITGATLLIGTVRNVPRAETPGFHSATASFDETESGVVVRTWSSRLALTALPDHFVLTTGGAGELHWKHNLGSTPLLVARDPALADSSVSSAWRRLHEAMLTAALQPIRERAPPRLGVAGAMISLGLVREAGSALEAAASDDPSVTADARFSLYRSIVVALDPASGADLAMPTAATRGDEADLWRVMAEAARPDRTLSPEQMHTVQADLALISAYPKPLRDLAAARAARLLLSGASASNPARIVGLPPSPEVSLAIAEAKMREGHGTAASAALRRLSGVADRSIATESLLNLIEVQAAFGQITPERAADELDHHQLDWRLIGEDQDAGVAAIRLRLRAGQLRLALSALRDLQSTYPATADQMAAEIAKTIGSIGSHRLTAATTPAETVGAIADNSDWLSAHPALARRLEPVLAERLAELGMPDLAADTLERAASLDGSATASGVTLLQIAEMRLAAGQIAAARDGLSRADQAGSPATMAGRRALIAAGIAVAEGDDGRALELIGRQDGSEANELRATIAEHRHDWAGAENALRQLVTSISGSDPLTPAQSAQVLRLAASASRAGDTATASDCVARFGRRIADESTRAALSQLADRLPPPKHRVGQDQGA